MITTNSDMEQESLHEGDTVLSLKYFFSTNANKTRIYFTDCW